MPSPTIAAYDVKSYFNADMAAPDSLPVAGGMAAVVSVRRPDNPGPNEDAAAVIPTGDDSAVLIVADGCGGMASGEQAARLAVESLAEQIFAAVNDGFELRGAILDGIEQAHRRIVDLKTGAGATVAVVSLEAGAARPLHVGDSQVMLVGGRGKVKLLTTSHSPVGYAVESGMLAEQEAIEHDERHLVTNYLGCEGMHVEVGSSRLLAARDAVLLASDGVFDNLLVDELVANLRSGPAATAAAKIAALAAARMKAPQDGKPHKQDDLTLIVFSRRG